MSHQEAFRVLVRRLAYSLEHVWNQVCAMLKCVMQIKASQLVECQCADFLDFWLYTLHVIYELQWKRLHPEAMYLYWGEITPDLSHIFMIVSLAL